VTIIRVVSLRNLLIHGYREVDVRRMFTDLKEGNVATLKKFEAMKRLRVVEILKRALEDGADIVFAFVFGNFIEGGF
jgi:hypothetical protein